MKVMLVNGSPHEKGCTWRALREIATTLEAEGIDSEMFWIGDEPLSGCTDCGYCASEGRCVFDDRVNAFIDAADEVDGFVFGAPVHFAGVAGAMTSFMDRVFYAARSAAAGPFALKPGACVVSARRAGTTAALDRFLKYLTISEMPVISSRYWPMVHGNTPAEVEQDLEGLQMMRVLARNMAWFLRCVEAGARAGVPLPAQEPRARTNFIR